MFSIATGPKENPSMVVKPKAVLDLVHEYDTDIFVTGPIEKYATRPDIFENMCLSDFITQYRHKSATDADPVGDNTI